MSIRCVVTPAGQLVVEIDDSPLTVKLDEASAEQLTEAFGQSSASGLLELASSKLKIALPADFGFWREFVQQFFHQLGNLSEAELKQVTKSKAQALKLVQPPAELTLVGLIENAPPMKGLEYLTTDALRHQWQQLTEAAIQRAAEFSEGPIGWLRCMNPMWNLLGRVTFHLAENKNDQGRPFAFLATYTHRMSAKAKVQHLPLADALKQYAGERNQEKLSGLLEPVRQAAKECDLVQEMLESRKLFQPHALTIGQAHRFLSNVPVMEAAGLVVRVPDWWRARSKTRPEVRIELGKKKASQVGLNSLLDFSVNLAVDGDPLTAAEQQQILESTSGLSLLRGKWVEVDSVKLQQALDHWHDVEATHGDGVSFASGMRMLAGVQLGADEVSEETARWSHVTAGRWLGDTLRQLRDPSGVVGCEPGRDLDATLRPYQEEGVRWLWFMTRLGLGACLADDMGLGKTIQVIDLLLTLKREEDGADGKRKKPDHRTSLLVVPASLVGNWKGELERFAPGLKVLYAHRSECDAQTLKDLAASPEKGTTGFDLVVTTYGLARRFEWLSQLTWRLIVLDEAQAIKNAASAQAKAVRKLQSAGRIALSGTPVENHVGELWSLFDFCCPGLLGNASQFKRFVKKLNQLQDINAYGALRKLVKPYILRRLKTDPGIVPDLPDKTEMRTECGLSKKQATLYQKAVKELERKLESTDEGIEKKGLVLSTLMQLKQICNHSSLYLGDASYSEKDSGKFSRLQQICQPIRERQERMLVFTQFQGMTQPIADYLEKVFGRSGLILHGGVAVGKRKKLVAEFQAEEGPPFFVISVKAGGTGLNLTAASHVVHFDRWWNPAVENQATDRAFRIGQKRNVLVHKFVCRGTVEERIDEMIRSKQELADKILSKGAEAQLTDMSDDELLDFVAIDLNRASSE